MFRKTLFAAALVAVTPALAFAAPTAAVTKTPAALSQPVKAHKVALVKHSKTKLAHKIAAKSKVKAKTDTVKS